MERMRKSLATLQAMLREDDGQAIVEYVLALSIVMFLVTIMATGLRNSLLKLWVSYSKQIAAPCPGCKADPAIHFR